MQVEVSIRILGNEGETAEELLGRCASLLKNQPAILVQPAGGQEKAEAPSDESEAGTPAPAKKRGRKSRAELEALEKAKAKKVEAEEDDDDDEIEMFDDDDDEDDDDEDEEEEVAPKKAKADKKSAKASGGEKTLDGDIIPAFKAFAQKNGSQAGMEILSGFGVDSVRDLDPGDFDKVLASIANFKPKKKKA